ncbi:hypothetical protein LPB67_13805 [Undibacterium sp. Jales W-56]|uniref:hypothetical protein n=1 Tax=Undibacterium sp. Jales W-56 TaxID=2897325 RepID=UPI0021D072D6|nr:hypothetical protein [Undibacterium sp. Jales W-56]MCU6434846.1 hypothetical protein [Undibacterium sp. Jales W-56]
MNRPSLIINSVLWAGAIIASAIVGAPSLLSTVLLPALAIMSLVLTEQKPKTVKCVQK